MGPNGAPWLEKVGWLAGLFEGLFYLQKPRSFGFKVYISTMGTHLSFIVRGYFTHLLGV